MLRVHEEIKQFFENIEVNDRIAYYEREKGIVTRKAYFKVTKVTRKFFWAEAEEDNQFSDYDVTLLNKIPKDKAVCEVKNWDRLQGYERKLYPAKYVENLEQHEQLIRSCSNIRWQDIPLAKLQAIAEILELEN